MLRQYIELLQFKILLSKLILDRKTAALAADAPCSNRLISHACGAHSSKPAARCQVRWDRHTDERPTVSRPCSTYYASSVNNSSTLASARLVSVSAYRPLSVKLIRSCGNCDDPNSNLRHLCTHNAPFATKNVHRANDVSCLKDISDCFKCR